MRQFRTSSIVMAVVMGGAIQAHAAVTISSGATQNMSCSNGVCAPTANKATLNVSDLESLLASGNVTVTTKGSGVQADDIHVSAALSWSNSSTLSLEAHRSIAINAAISIEGQSGLTLDTGGKSGALSFGKNGSASFASLSSQLAINGHTFTLVGDIKTLASDIANNSSGNFALAANYNASGDGTYPSSPVANTFIGTFEGLGNTISNLTINDPVDRHFVGLFAEAGAGGRLRHIGLVNAIVSGAKGADLRLRETVGALAGINDGTIAGSYSSGMISGLHSSFIGGLVGENDGTITSSYSSAAAKCGHLTLCGGLVGRSTGTISGSHATGKVEGGHIFAGGGLVGFNFGGLVTLSYATGAVGTGEGIAAHGGGLVGENVGTVSYSFANGAVSTYGNGGGLAGYNGGTIGNSYATGTESGYSQSLGGLVGANEDAVSSIAASYSTGVVAGDGTQYVGGFVGYDENPGDIANAYWDLDTSGITDPSQGAGNIANDPGITGLTTEQLQSGLPPGFDPAVWGENPNINGGLPYLLANPPPK